jgi:subtilase family serine protease
VHGVTKNGLTIDFSGTAATVGRAFQTAIHYVQVNGQRHITNVTTPKVPAALSPVIAGVVSLHDFKPKPLIIKPKSNFSIQCNGCPNGFDGLELYLEAPADFATIYNVAPLYKDKTPITGKGVTVVVLEDTDIQHSDVQKFRSAFGLSAYSGTFSEIHPGPGCSDPGKNVAEGEAALDAEWAGAVAPDATVKLASCADTTTNFGAFIAAQNLLDSVAPPAVMSLSYLTCEADAGPGPNGNGYVFGLWQQAAAEGVSIFVSAGDGGPAGCDDFDTAEYAVGGIAANAFASTPYNTATGGTDFLDTAEGTNSTYWKLSNSASGKSALSYIPEMPWNDTCASSVFYEYVGYSDPISFCNSAIGSLFYGIVAGSGAPSYVYAKPYWQENIVGIPNDGVRDLPDVSLFASNGFWNHAILFCMSDAKQGGAPCDYNNPTDVLYNSAGGTSFTAPQFASIQALIDQKAGGLQGNAAPIYYDLARAEYGTASHPNGSKLRECNSSSTASSSSSCVFHDVTVGTNDVPCYGPVDCYNPDPSIDIGVLSTSDTKLKPAYSTQTGWDFATGLGTVNVNNLVKAWP